MCSALGKYSGAYMKPIRIKHRRKAHQEALIDSYDSLKNWAMSVADYSQWRFFEETADRFIRIRFKCGPNRADNYAKLERIIKAHFKGK